MVIIPVQQATKYHDKSYFVREDEVQNRHIKEQTSETRAGGRELIVRVPGETA